ncbi:MAG: peptidase [Rubrivivax sp.]
MSCDTLARNGVAADDGGMPEAAQIHIFQAGHRTTMAGVSLDFSEADLQASAAAYNPSLHEAPICVGHPKHDLPAYGWVSSVTARAGGLYAQPSQVDPEFAEMVRKGRFKKVSAAFYAPDSPVNPVPGVYYPRHVAFLGAQPPAVKGLKQAEFADADEQLVFAEMEFSGPAFGYVVSIFRGLRDFFIEQFGLEKADAVMPAWRVDSLDEMARRDGELSGGPAFREGHHLPTPNRKQEDHVSAEKIAQLEADLAAERQRADAAEAARRADQEARRKAEATARHDANVAFAENLVKSDQLLPADRDLVVAALDAATGDDKPLEFGEGDAKKPLAEALRGLFEKLPKHALTGDHLARRHSGGDAPADDPAALAAQAVAFQESQAAKGIVVSTAEAAQAVLDGCAA